MPVLQCFLDPDLHAELVNVQTELDRTGAGPSRGRPLSAPCKLEKEWLKWMSRESSTELSIARMFRPAPAEFAEWRSMRDELRRAAVELRAVPLSQVVGLALDRGLPLLLAADSPIPATATRGRHVSGEISAQSLQALEAIVGASMERATAAVADLSREARGLLEARGYARAAPPVERALRAALLKPATRQDVAHAALHLGAADLRKTPPADLPARGSVLLPPPPILADGSVWSTEWTRRHGVKLEDEPDYWKFFGGRQWLDRHRVDLRPADQRRGIAPREAIVYPAPWSPWED